VPVYLERSSQREEYMQNQYPQNKPASEKLAQGILTGGKIWLIVVISIFAAAILCCCVIGVIYSGTIISMITNLSGSH
jgi:hypothetical protein